MVVFLSTIGLQNLYIQKFANTCSRASVYAIKIKIECQHWNILLCKSGLDINESGNVSFMDKLMHYIILENSINNNFW